MDELLRQVLAYVRGAWMHRWIALATAWVVGIIGTGVILAMPNKYEASARIYVDTQSVLKPLMSGLAIQPDVNQQLNMLTRTLLTRPNIEKIMRMSDLDLTAKGPKDKERLIDELIASIKLGAGRGDNIYNISYRNESPDKAKKIVQTLVTMFVESGLGDKRKDTESARKFIEEQIKQHEEKLLEAENRIKEFRLRNLAIDEEFGKDSFERMTELSNQIQQARLELREAENSRDAMKQQLQSGEQELLTAQQDADPVKDFSVPELDGRIDGLKRNLDELLRKYTEAHPDVAGTKRIIAQLEDQKRQEVEKLKKTAAATPKSAGAAAPMANPVTQQLKVALAEAEASVASLRSRVAEYKGRLAKVRQRLQLQPQIESEYMQLNRDHAVIKRNYDQLVSRRESASMTTELESSATLAEFRLIEPPRTSPKPVAPNRPLMLSGLFGVAVVAGLALAFVWSQVRPTFFDARTLREATGLPILGAVSFLPDDNWIKKTRRRAMAFLSCLAGLIAAYGGALAFLLWSARGV